MQVRDKTHLRAMLIDSKRQVHFELRGPLLASNTPPLPFHSPVLNVVDLLTESSTHRTETNRTDLLRLLREDDVLSAGEADPAHRRDDDGRADAERLAEDAAGVPRPEVGHRHLPLTHVEVERGRQAGQGARGRVGGSEFETRGARQTGENGTVQWGCDHVEISIVPGEDHEEVHSARLRHATLVLLTRDVQSLVQQPEHLIVPPLRRPPLGQEPGRVVQAELVLARPARPRARVLVPAEERDRPRRAEHGPRGRGEHVQRRVVGRGDAERGARADDRRPEVEAAARCVGDPARLDGDETLDDFEELRAVEWLRGTWEAK